MIVLRTMLYIISVVVQFLVQFGIVMFFVQLFNNITNIAECHILYHTCHGKFIFLGTLNPFNPNGINASHSTKLFCCFSHYHVLTNSIAPYFCIQTTHNPQFLESLQPRANAQNISFWISLPWPIHIINPVDKINLSWKIQPVWIQESHCIYDGITWNLLIVYHGYVALVVSATIFYMVW